MTTNEYDYDIALSFSGADRDFVEEVASLVRYFGYSVFYDSWEQHRLWGEDLYTYFADIYAKKARYCLIFVSQSYIDRAWPQHERRFAQSRQLFSQSPYLLPVLLEEVKVPGIPATMGILDARTQPASFVAVNVAKKLGSFSTSLDPSLSAECFEHILRKRIDCAVSVHGDFLFKAQHRMLYLGPRPFLHFGFYEESMEDRPFQLASLRARDANGPVPIKIVRDFDKKKHVRVELREPLHFGQETTVAYSYRCLDYFADITSPCCYIYTVGRVRDFLFSLTIPRGHRFIDSDVFRSFKEERVGSMHEIAPSEGKQRMSFTAREPPRGTKYEIKFQTTRTT